MAAETAPVSEGGKRRSAAVAAGGGLSATATGRAAHVRIAICEARGLIGSCSGAARHKAALCAATQRTTAGEADGGETTPPTSGCRFKMAPVARGSGIVAHPRRR